MNDHVAACLDEWRKRLLDLSKRNPLINCRLSPKSALELSHPSVDSIWEALFSGNELPFPWKRDLVGEEESAPEEDTETATLSLFGSDDERQARSTGESRIPLEECLASPRLEADSLLTMLTDRALGSRLNRLSLNAKTSLAEQGINVLFVAFGFVKWFESEDSEMPLLSPLLLVPVVLDRVGTTAPWKLSVYEEEITPNYCLRELFRRDLRINLPLPDIEKFPEMEFSREDYFRAVRLRIKDQERWELFDQAVLGQFSFQKLAMYEDYGNNAAEIAMHAQCQRIAGDPRAPLVERFSIPAPAEFDAAIHPSKLHAVLPCDASQIEAVMATKAGASLVLDGPPGTGKSQTIANMIAECLADGKTVLFVSEKAAALEVVKRRLDHANLADFVLDCHSHKAGKKEVIAELGRCLSLNPERYADRAAELERLFHSREQLNSYVAALHNTRQPLNLSAFEVHGRLAKLGRTAVSRSRIANPMDWTSAQFTAAANRLRALADYGHLLANYEGHAWQSLRIDQYSLSLEDEIKHRFSSLARGLEALSDPLATLVTEGQLEMDASLIDLRRKLEHLRPLLMAEALPPSWLGERRNEVTSLIKSVMVDSEQYRQQVIQLDEFEERAIGQASAFAAFESELNDQQGWLRLVRLPPTERTIRVLRQTLASLRDDLLELAQRSESVGEAVHDVIAALKFPVTALTYGTIGVLKEIAEHIGKCGVLQESWFDPSKIAAIREFARTSLRRWQELTDRRERLKVLFADLAFQEQGRALAKRYGEFTSIWNRLWGGWMRDAAHRISRLEDQLANLTTLLKSGADIEIRLLSSRVRSLSTASATRDEVRVNAEKLEGLVAVSPTPEKEDWQGHFRTACYLERLLQIHRDSIPREIMQVVSDCSSRQRIADAFHQLEEVLAKGIDSEWAYLETLFPTDRPLAHGIVLERFPIKSLIGWLTEQAGRTHSLRVWLTCSELRRDIATLGLGELVSEVLNRDLRAEDCESAFAARFYRLWLDTVYQQDAVLRVFQVEEHERLIENFRTLDRQAIQSSVGRLRTKLLNDPQRPHAEVLNAPATSEMGVLLREVNKRRKHLPLRQLFQKVPNLLLRVKPCLMMSPLAVSTYLDTAELRFDVVIFDEASQVLPWDAIGAVYRGKQLVVAGDQKQLPPTTFFDRMVEEDDVGAESTDDLKNFESVLDVLCSVGLPHKRLRWHYRSKREPLIAFSNRYFYNNELMTFPSPHDLDSSSAVSFRHVQQGRWRSKAGFNPVEAREVAEAVIEHFRQYPDQSLGVITLNQRQQLAVWDELSRLRQDWPEYDALFADGREEPFFVKNLENVQGDERDRIILSVVYGPDEATGQLNQRFGPLNSKGGERRLNVAVTRAKEAMTIFSSMRADQIDLNRTGSEGARLLRAYLEYAEHGPQNLSRVITQPDEDFDSPFEEAVAERLTQHSLDVRKQVGCGGYRIDLALVDPQLPGRYVLGIECDGAAYHRTATARDRDRIRQEILCGLGWRIIRVWSTDWIRDPGRQMERILKEYREALHNREDRFSASESNTKEVRERPTIRIRELEADDGGSRYDSIDAVPDVELSRVLVSLTLRYGSTAHDDLVRSTARELGFQRTGNRIHARIASAIEALLRQGRLRRDNPDRVSAS